MSINNDLNIKTIADMSGADYFNLLRNLELVTVTDLEKIINYFVQYFDISQRNLILKNFNSPNYSSARAILDVLKHNCATIVELYDCMRQSGLIDIQEFLENNYPSETKLLNISTNYTDNLINESNQPIAIYTQSTHTHNLFSNFLTNQQQQQTIVPTVQQSQSNIDLTCLTTIILSEELLPVIYENKINDGHSPNISSPKRTGEQLNPKKLFGYFQVCYIDDRKLTFRKREFTDPLYYTKELKMIKYRHLNLYTAECILKNLNRSSYFLLYNYDTLPTQLLTDFAENYYKLKPSQYNTLHQLEILRDISCGLAFLHDKNEFKKTQTLHGNLHPDSILIEIRGEDQVSAKLFDFVHTVEVNELDNFDAKIRDEFFKFGQIIFMVATWHYLDRTECEKIHNEKKTDEELYLYDLFRRFEMDKQPNSLLIQYLLKMFYKLTSSNYDISKGINKSYTVIKDLLQKLNEKKTTVWK